MVWSVSNVKTFKIHVEYIGQRKAIFDYIRITDMKKSQTKDSAMLTNVPKRIQQK